MVVPGPVIIGFDGTAAAERAIRESGRLLGPRAALVVTVWEAGQAFGLAARPGIGLEASAAALDVRTAEQVDAALYEAAQRSAQHGAALADEAGFQGEALVVADEVTVADTLVRLARERGSSAIVVGSHGHNALAEVLLGSTTRGVLKHADCPVIVVRGDGGEPDEA